MRKVQIFQSDDVFDNPVKYCSCRNKLPYLDGRFHHWECKRCGLLLERKDRAIIQQKLQPDSTQ